MLTKEKAVNTPEWWLTIFCCTLAAQIVWRLYPPRFAIFVLLAAVLIGLLVRNARFAALHALGVWLLFQWPGALALLAAPRLWTSHTIRAAAGSGWRAVLRAALAFVAATILVVEGMLAVAPDAGFPYGSPTLTGLLGERAVPALIAGLKKRSAYRRAMQSLKQIGEPAVPALIAFVCDKNNAASTRVSTVSMLERLDYHRAAPTLIAVVRDKNDDAWVRWSVAQELRRRYVDGLVPALAAVLQDRDEDVVLRRLAVETLSEGARGSEGDALVSLLSAIHRDKSDAAEVRRAAADALRALTPRAGPAGSPPPDRGILPERRDWARSSAPG